jgi:hypothetical protein
MRQALANAMLAAHFTDATNAMTRFAQAAMAFSPAAAWKELSFSFDFAASPQNQTNLNYFRSSLITRHLSLL